MLITFLYSENGIEIILFKIFRIGLSYDTKEGYWSMLYLGLLKISIGICINYSNKRKQIKLTKKDMHEA